MSESYHIVTLKEAAAYLRLSERSLWTKINSGEIHRLPGYGRSIRILKSELDRWLQDQAA